MSGDETLKELFDWLVRFVDGAIKAVLCLIYSGVRVIVVTVFPSSASLQSLWHFRHFRWSCHQRSFQGNQRYCALLNIHILLKM